MEFEDLIKKQEKKLDKLLPCIRSSCDGNGIIPEQDGEGDWQPAQCEYCYRVRFPVKELISKICKETIEHERERIQNIIKEMPDTFPELESDDYDEAYQDAKQYILNKLS